MTKVKKVPLRRCTGCGQSLPKKELLRVVRTPEGEIVLDEGGRKNGRGTYLCRSAKCLAKAKKSGKLASHLECEIPDDIYASLEEKISEVKNG